MIWDLSGVPRLLNAISARVAEGSGHETIERTARAALNLVAGVSTGTHMVSMRIGDSRLPPLDRKAIPAELARIEAESVAELERAFDEVVTSFNTRLDRSHRSFLDRATASLLTHLEQNGDAEVWQYDATGLRVLLRSAYNVFARNAQVACQGALLKATASVRELYLRAFSVPDAGFRLEAPPAPQASAPVLLGQTIALDLSTNWWSRASSLWASSRM